MATREIPLPTPRFGPVWRVIQAAGVVAVGAIIILLFAAPEPTLAWTWNVVVPVLPATFLLTPAIWRNACPLATLNEIPTHLGRRGRHPSRAMASGALAVIALFVLVPARRAVLNASGEALAGVLIALGLLALVLGSLFAARSGFCNGVCPVLPVERLYGQHPLIELRGSRCASCTFCTPAGCIDLARGKAMVQMLGRSRHTPRWLLTPMGVFATAFPGLILGYFVTPDATGFGVGALVRVLAFAAASYVALGAILALTRVRATLALTLLGGLSFALYYWFAAPGFAGQLGLGRVAADSVRAAAGVLLTVWLVRAGTWRPSGRRDATGSPGR